VGIAGNQPAAADAALRELGVEADIVASSASWGVEKPSPGFFAQIVAAAGVAAPEIAYVGDRLDNDVLPARSAGMTTIFLARGPWGRVHAERADARLADWRLTSLVELPDALATLQRR